MFINELLDKSCDAITDTCIHCARGLPFNEPRGIYHMQPNPADGGNTLVACTAVQQRANFTRILGEWLSGHSQNDLEGKTIG
jgi:hypothetical protein